MRFLDELRDFLRHPVAVPAYDILEYRRHFLATLERRERAGADEEWLRQQHANLGRRLDRFTAALSRHLLHAGIPSGEVSDFVKKGISLALESDERPDSVTRTLLLRSAVEHTLQEVLYSFASALHLEEDPEDPWRDIAAYAQEIRAVRSRGDELVVTAIGRALLDLNGLDAVKWLLHVEAALSTGPGDPWRVDRGTLRDIVRNPRLVLPEQVWAEKLGPRLSWVTLGRLDALGVVKLVLEPREVMTLVQGYQAHEQMRPILDEIASGEESPMSVLVGAMLEDDLQSRLPGRSPSAVAEATVRQALLVVHEVRNALIPVQVALGSIYRSAHGAGIDDAIATYRQRVDAGLKRVLSFATELGDVARLTGETEEFDAGAAIREAIAAVQGESGGAPALSLPAQSPLLRGVRTRFVLALVNLLRNAYQAAPAESARAAVQVESAGGRLRITIDDNGPGVAPAERERIFLDGFSTRAGGSGQGLALARATIEGDMGGTLACDDGSSLGGARFTIILTPYHGSAA